jgi:undecaprenyl-diphosphatase
MTGLGFSFLQGRSPAGWLRHSSRWARREFWTLLALFLIAGGVWTFVEIADEVVEGETQTLDERLLLSLREPGAPEDPLGPRWVEEMARDFTALGGMAILTLLTLAVAGFLLLNRKTHVMWLVLAAVLGGMLLSYALKYAFDRARPDLVPHGSHVHTSSFPSGHSTMAAVAYLTLAALLARMHENRWMKLYLLSLAVTLTVLVGVSRVYLGVHWPTDVLAGWALGSAWALFCWIVAAWLQRRGKIEREGPEPELGSS